MSDELPAPEGFRLICDIAEFWLLICDACRATDTIYLPDDEAKIPAIAAEHRCGPEGSRWGDDR